MTNAKENMLKRCSCVLLMLAMLLAFLPVNAFAAEAETDTYVLMNIPYAAFYQGEGVAVDVVSAATPNKAKNDSLAANSYYDGTAAEKDVAILGVTYPVKVSADVLKSDTYTKVEDSAALRSAGSYAYAELKETPTAYKQLTVQGDTASFGAVTGAKKVEKDVTAALSTGGDGHHAFYYEIAMGVDADEVTGNVCAVAVKTADNGVYGLRHVVEIWRSGIELGFETNHALEGKTVTEIDYYLNDGSIYTIDVDDLYIPINTKSATLTVEAAKIDAMRTTGTIADLPQDFAAAYTVTKDNAATSIVPTVKDGAVTLTWEKPVAQGTYTLTATDKNGKYAPVKATFVLSTDKVYATYDASGKKLVAKAGVTEDEFKAYVAAIATVTVDDTDYRMSGRGAVAMINKDGSLNTEQDKVNFSAGTHTVVVKATGYPDLEFSVVNPLTDVPSDAWYAEAVNAAAKKGLMVGIGNNLFDPQGVVPRCQVAQIVYNMAGKPEITGTHPFTDVPASAWYNSVVTWAYQNKVVNGTTATTFEPNKAISRQDFALMLYRYAGAKKTAANLDKFADAKAVSDYAQDAVQWAVANGILQGDEKGMLNPKGTLTRAEAATILVRYVG